MATEEDPPSAAEIARLLNLMLRAGRRMEVTMARRLGLKVTDLRALDNLVHHQEDIGPADLGQLLGITSASATTLADRLERVGHLRRTPHRGDRRRVDLIPTDSARDDVRAVLAPLLAEITAITDRLAPGQAAAVAGFLDDVSAAMVAFNDRSSSH